MYETTPMCERCGDPFAPTQETQKYCSATCREAAKKRRSRLRPLADKLLGRTPDTGDTSLTSMPGTTRATWRADPRNFSDFGQVPGDDAWLEPDEIDELEDNIYAGQLDDDDAHERRNQEFQNKIVANDMWRVPSDILREWQSYAKRHGTVHPAEQEYRIKRGLAAHAADWSQGTSRFTAPGSRSLADMARASRALNKRYTTQPQRPVETQFTPPPSRMAQPQQVSNFFYGDKSRNRAGHRAGSNTSTAWQMTDGFNF